MSKNDFVSDKRLYLDKEGNVVGDDDPNKHSLLVSAGGTLPMEEAEKYGLTKEEGEEAADEGAEPEEDADDAVPTKKAPAKKTAKKK